jgi:hypothetical protein
VALIQEVVTTCADISRNELAHTICELLNWKRPTGRLEAAEGLQLLERLERQGILALPAKKSPDKVRSPKRISPSGQAAVASELAGSVEQFTPIEVELVQCRTQRRLFRELVDRYHYLGYAMPFGARLAKKYGLDPYLVDSQRFYGGCYRASNFIVLGQTSGRGRMDRNHQRHGAQVKTVMVYPLVKDARQRLADGRDE